MNNRASIADLSPSAQRQALEQIRPGPTIFVKAPANPYPLRKSKYNNKKCEIDGYRFDSLKETNRYLYLKALLHKGEITKLEVHPKFELKVNGIKIATYIGDFAYVSRGPLVNVDVVEDVKGVKTALYKIKKKLMLACHGVEVKEI